MQQSRASAHYGCAILLALSAGPVACGSSHPPSIALATPGPRVTVLDSIVLLEDETHFVGHPGNLHVDEKSGDVFVGDLFGKRVLRFAADGEFRREYGGPSTPGERIRSLYDFVLNDSSVIAVDEKHHELVVYSLDSGAFRERIPFEQTQPDFAAGPRGVLFAGGPDAANGSIFTRWDVRDKRRTTMLAIGGEVVSTPALSTEWFVHATHWSDSVVVSLGPSDNLYVLTDDGRFLSLVVLPVRSRRGIPDSHVHGKRPTPTDLLNGISVVVSLAHLPTGELAVVHHENTLVRDGYVTTQLWVTLLAPDLATACVDVPIPAVSESMPFPAFRGDTLLVLTQGVAGGSGHSVVRRFVIDETACTWIPTKTFKRSVIASHG
jgi:hypothetical protein